jgi:peptidoglycan/LPS O-acetylase OafA/YrhL
VTAISEGEAAGSRPHNNFDAIRALAASAVVFSHAFLIAEGTQENEPLVRLTGQAILGLLGVFVFFTMSGYLVTRSWLADPSPPRFLWRRGLRIFPALWVNLLLVGLVMGPLVTSLPLGDYVSSPLLPEFFRANLLLELPDRPLPGVSFSDNPVGPVVNGSLWTLRYEIMMYLMVLVLGWLGLLRLWISLALLALGVAALFFEKLLAPLGDFGEFLWFLGFFAAGMAMSFLRGSRLLDWRLAAAAGLGLVLAARFGHLIGLFPIFGGYLAIFLALKYAPGLRFLRSGGDLSYGIYIYGWPVEQGLMWATDDRIAWWQLFPAALAVSAALAWCSWHAVEKRALSLKRLAPRPGSRLRRMPEPALPSRGS